MNPQSTNTQKDSQSNMDTTDLQSGLSKQERRELKKAEAKEQKLVREKAWKERDRYKQSAVDSTPTASVPDTTISDFIEDSDPSWSFLRRAAPDRAQGCSSK